MTLAEKPPTISLFSININRVSEFVFNVPPTAKVKWRWGHGLESHMIDWRS